MPFPITTTAPTPHLLAPIESFNGSSIIASWEISPIILFHNTLRFASSPLTQFMIIHIFSYIFVFICVSWMARNHSAWYFICPASQHRIWCENSWVNKSTMWLIQLPRNRKYQLPRLNIFAYISSLYIFIIIIRQLTKRLNTKMQWPKYTESNIWPESFSPFNLTII